MENGESIDQSFTGHYLVTPSFTFSPVQQTFSSQSFKESALNYGHILEYSRPWVYARKWAIDLLHIQHNQAIIKRQHGCDRTQMCWNAYQRRRSGSLVFVPSNASLLSRLPLYWQAPSNLVAGFKMAHITPLLAIKWPSGRSCPTVQESR